MVLYLDGGAGFKFKGLCLPVLQIHLQNVGQEEQRSALWTTQKRTNVHTLYCKTFVSLIQMVKYALHITAGCKKTFLHIISAGLLLSARLSVVTHLSLLLYGCRKSFSVLTLWCNTHVWMLWSSNGELLYFRQSLPCQRPILHFSCFLCLSTIANTTHQKPPASCLFLSWCLLSCNHRH